jgi:hypothetical protein
MNKTAQNYKLKNPPINIRNPSHGYGCRWNLENENHSCPRLPERPDPRRGLIGRMISRLLCKAQGKDQHEQLQRP